MNKAAAAACLAVAGPNLSEKKKSEALQNTVSICHLLYFLFFNFFLAKQVPLGTYKITFIALGYLYLFNDAWDTCNHAGSLEAYNCQLLNAAQQEQAGHAAI